MRAFISRPIIDALTQDVRLALRSLRRYPLASGVAILSLGAGIGSTTALLTIRNAIFFNPPPGYARPAELSRITVSTPERANDAVPGALYALWADDAMLGPGLAASGRGRTVDLRTTDRVETVNLRAVTPQLFSQLGVTPLLGRTFDAASSSTREAILSYRVWQNTFGGRADIIGTVAWLDDEPHVVVGVMPASFWFGRFDSPIWSVLYRSEIAASDRFDVVLRSSRPDNDATTAALERGRQDYVRQLGATGTAPAPADDQVRVHRSGIGGTAIGREIGPAALWTLAASVLLTLLIACTNVAVLMIAQWSAREHELAIRSSIGASRGRIVRSLLSESIVMAVLGGALGVCATFALRGVILSNLGEFTFLDLTIAPAVFGQVAALTVAAGVITGLAPALFETRRLQTNPLRMIAPADRVRQRWRHALVVFEITGTIALLVVTAVLITAYDRTIKLNPGFDPTPLLTARVSHETRIPVDAILERLRAMPDVVNVAASTVVPFSAPGPQRLVAASAGAAGQIGAEHVIATPTFFETLAVSMRAGRAFDRDEAASGAEVVVINAALADRLWPGQVPLGEPLWIDNMPHAVIGIVHDFASTPLARRARPSFYLPLRPSDAVTQMQFAVRSATPSAAAAAVRREIRNIDRTQTVSAFALTDVLQAGGQEILVATYPMIPLIATGILLTAAGIYGVLAFAITRRSRELAVRLAVGATPLDVLGLVTRHSARLLAVGTACGVLATYALTRIAQGTGGVFESPGWPAFAVPVAIVAIVGAAATWVPARRALRISPASLLRE